MASPPCPSCQPCRETFVDVALRFRPLLGWLNEEFALKPCNVDVMAQWATKKQCIWATGKRRDPHT